MHWLFWSLLFIRPLLAYQSTVNSSGVPLYWANSSIPIYIRTNTSDLPANTTRSIILDSINQWNQASLAKISSASSSSNEIRFSNDFSMYGSAVIGLTELTYNSSGVIQKAVISLNDNYTFTTTPSSFGDGSVFLGDVVTHELGHLLGLAHSEVLNSSMFYTSFPGQSSITSDDRSGIRQKYGPSHGVITGTVRGGNNIGVLGVHVQAISRKTGEVVGVVSDENGSFVISGLELNDSYYIYTSPIKNVSSLPGYFANVQTSFCPSSYVGSFFSACGRENEGFPQAITLNDQNTYKDVGMITINCSLKTSDEYSYQKIQSNFSPVIIWDSLESERRELAFVGYHIKPKSSTWTNWETLRVDMSGVASPPDGQVKMSFIGHPFGNLLEYEVRVLKDGIVVADEGISESLLLGTYNTNIDILHPLSSFSSENVFDIEIRARNLTTNVTAFTFPSSSIFATNSFMPYLLIIGVQSGGKIVQNTKWHLSDNSSCLDAPFTYKVNKTKPKYEVSSIISNDDALGVGAACATIGPTDGTGTGSGLVLVAFGFLFTLLLGLVSKKSKNFLS